MQESKKNTSDLYWKFDKSIKWGARILLCVMIALGLIECFDLNIFLSILIAVIGTGALVFLAK